MHWSIPNFNIPAGNPPGIWTFDDWLTFQFPPPPPPPGQNCIQIPYPSASFDGKCLSRGCLKSKKKKRICINIMSVSFCNQQML